MPASRRTLAAALAAALAVHAAEASEMNTIRVASGLNYPVFATAPAGDTERLFIVEQRGVIRILEGGVVLPTPFLDIDSLTTTPSINDERGLLGLTFAPDYATSGHFYVYYTDNASDSRLRRYTVSGNPDVASAATAFNILFQDQPFNNHNGGTIQFGPDGYLYLGLGDGGGSGDPQGNGQNGSTLLGKMLRLDPTGDDFPADANQNYRVPPTNPFVGNPGFRDEIWAYGLRNPYRWGFDRATGDLWLADVGQGCWEEINFEAAGLPGGRNYGWDILEGNHCFVPGQGCTPTGCDSSGVTFPVREYSHTQDVFSCSVTGGYPYRGAVMPIHHGMYFYADYCSGQIYTFRYDGMTLTGLTNRTAELAPDVGTISSPVAFGEDGVGELYIVDRASTTGEVFKIVPDPESTGTGPSPAPVRTFALGRPWPNPFDASTAFELSLPRAGHLSLSIHDAAGRRVRSLWQGPSEARSGSVTWDGRDGAGRSVPAGVYFVRAESEGRTATRRLVRVR
jgi:hypothetical protein